MKSLVLASGAVTLLLCAGPAVARQQPAEPGGASKEVHLIEGVDGAPYEPYLPSVIEEVQSALKTAGLYSGEVNGILDEETMQAIAEYQKQNGIQVSGVPSPETRAALLGRTGTQSR